jgi:tetratricopeptide (TPR) repeat protein
MTVIRVSEQSVNPDRSFVVRVAFDEEAEYVVRVSDPADLDTEELLAWYFEKHLQFPFLDLDRERQAVTRLAEYGQDLFGQIFGGEANYDFRRLRGRSFDDCRLEVRGSVAFHQLHWEALRDPKMDAPLVVRLPVTRRVGPLESKFELPPKRAMLNILLVTARPFGSDDVGYRTISRPLLDALRRSKLPVTIHLVRPGTWEALRNHLESVTEEHGSGWYQVIHFDLHGGFSEFADLKQLRKQGRLLFPAAPVEPFEGRRPFLFFETTQKKKAGPVPAATVASLLAEHRIPVAVLNACQSAMQVGSEASLALHLVQAGIPAAVGMAYSVTVSAAALAMPVLYGRLTQGADPVMALYAARRCLYDNRGRKVYFDQQLDLEDWVLPVAFRQQPLQLQLAPMDDSERADFYQRQADVGDEPPTEYGFVGRDLDIQAIERRLLASPDANELLVQGLAGAGKSTLLRHLAWWWQRTGLVEKVFHYSFEDRAWTCEQIIREIRSELFSEVDQARADTMTQPAQLEQIAQMLRASRHLFILDNAESVTATPAAIPHALHQAEQGKLKTLLSRLRGGQTLVLVGSREAEAWLARGSFGRNVYPLPGLDPQAASVLVERILGSHDALRWLQDTAERDALQGLIELLGGYPLPMTVVLPVLAATAPSAVVAKLREGGTGPDPSGQITRAIEYSHGKLDPALQNSLLMLAPFTAVIPTGQTLDDYQGFLLADETVRDLGPIDLARAVAEATKVGLATPHPELRGWVQVQPVLPYFLRSRLRQQEHLRDATSQAHYRSYASFGPALQALLLSHGTPKGRALGQAATRAEYANLTSALTHGLETRQPIIPLIGPLEEYLDQTQQQTSRRQLLDNAIANYPELATKDQHSEFAQLHNLAGLLAFQQNRLDNAKAHHETELRQRKAADDRPGQGLTYNQLAMVGIRQRRFEEAEANCRQALDILLESGERRTAARAYHQLGMVAQEQRRFEEAEASYRKSLDIKLEFGERYLLGNTYHQLGKLAQEQQRFEEAEASYRKALDIYLEFGDPSGAADAYHNLGTVAQEQRRFEEAGASYRKALGIYLKSDDQYHAAYVYFQLGQVAEEQRRLEEAEAIYRKALDIFLKSDDQYHVAHTHYRLGQVAEEQRRLEEAEASYRKALDIFRDLDQQYAALTASLLGRLRGRQQDQAGSLSELSALSVEARQPQPGSGGL